MDEKNMEPRSNVIEVDIQKEMQKSFLDYSMSVIVSRALPDVRDGLKPVHRRILYSQYEDGLTPDKAYKKCATTVGNVLGRYHPHGDASVYDALVRLAQDFSMHYPLVDGHGNFGSVDGDPPAAYRYTEARMSKISTEMLTDIDKDTVNFISNYDDSRKEPEVLPSRFPNLLVNGSTGIAVGMATNIPPHNLGETIDAVCYLIDNPDAGLEDLMEYIKGPDFPTGAMIMGRAGIRAAYATGRGKITVRAVAEIVEEKNGRFKIIVTELPYQVNKARLIESIADMVKDKRIEGISNIDDHSDRNGMHIEIDLKRDASPQIVLNQLYSYTQMQTTFGVIMLAIVNGEPKTLTLKEMLQEYIKFQEEVITRRTIYDLKKARERAHILEGLKIALDNIDEIIEAADGIMIARGDMGVEIPPEYVPVIQQKIIQKVYTAGKPVITATQMLDSMISHPRPTRAEATDVANAIFQGTSATMLSGETAAGKYPVQALQMMSRIAEHMEQNIDYNTIFKKTDRNENPDITNAIAHATCLTAIDLKASAILAVTKSGSTAHMMSKHRPGCLIGACTSSERVLRQLNLSWGVYPMLIKEEYSSEILCLRAIEAAQKHKLVKVGDTIVFAGGVPLGIPGRTNLIRVCTVE